MRSRTTELGTPSTRVSPSMRTARAPLNEVSHTASDTCSRSTSAQAFHRTSASSTCSNASPPVHESTTTSTPVENTIVGEAGLPRDVPRARWVPGDDDRSADGGETDRSTGLGVVHRGDLGPRLPLGRASLYPAGTPRRAPVPRGSTRRVGGGAAEPPGAPAPGGESITTGGQGGLVVQKDHRKPPVPPNHPPPAKKPGFRTRDAARAGR